MNIEGNKPNRLNKLMCDKIKLARRFYEIGTKVQN